MPCSRSQLHSFELKSGGFIYLYSSVELNPPIYDLNPVPFSLVMICGFFCFPVCINRYRLFNSLFCFV